MAGGRCSHQRVGSPRAFTGLDAGAARGTAHCRAPAEAPRNAAAAATAGVSLARWSQHSPSTPQDLHPPTCTPAHTTPTPHPRP